MPIKTPIWAETLARKISEYTISTPETITEAIVFDLKLLTEQEARKKWNLILQDLKVR